MTAPDIHRLDRYITETELSIRLALSDLHRDYALAHGLAHERIVRDSVGRPPGHADPTGGIVVGPVTEGPDGQVIDSIGAQANLRRVLERVPKRLAELESDATAISKAIRRAMDPFDPPQTPPPADGRYPRTVGETELDDLRRKARDRVRRGEGVA